MALQDNSQNYADVNQGIDRITEILKTQSTPQAYSSFQPQASQLPMNILNAINYSGRSYPGAMSSGGFAQDVQKYETTQQTNQLAQQQSLLNAYEAKLKMGDAQTKALDDKIKMFVGDDPYGKETILNELNALPDNIDPASPATYSIIAGIAKRNGLQNIERDLGIAEKQSDIRYKNALSERAQRIVSGGQKPPSGYRYKADGQTLEPIPGGPGEKMSAEIAARVGLANKFLKEAPDIKKSVRRGVVTGAFDYAKGALGRGESGKVRRRIEDGADALQRMLTGAGMPVAEADDYTRRFRVGKLDNSDILLDKVTNLENALTSQIEVAMRGHGALNPEDAAGSTDNEDPRIQQARDAGYSDEEIQQFLSGGQ